jgi:hypothetical protein
MHPAIAQYRSGISAICQRYDVHLLAVFSSAARADVLDPGTWDPESQLIRFD